MKRIHFYLLALCAAAMLNIVGLYLYGFPDGIFADLKSNTSRVINALYVSFLLNSVLLAFLNIIMIVETYSPLKNVLLNMVRQNKGDNKKEHFAFIILTAMRSAYVFIFLYFAVAISLSRTPDFLVAVMNYGNLNLMFVVISTLLSMALVRIDILEADLPEDRALPLNPSA